MDQVQGVYCPDHLRLFREWNAETRQQLEQKRDKNGRVEHGLCVVVWRRARRRFLFGMALAKG